MQDFMVAITNVYLKKAKRNLDYAQDNVQSVYKIKELEQKLLKYKPIVKRQSNLAVHPKLGDKADEILKDMHDHQPNLNYIPASATRNAEDKHQAFLDEVARMKNDVKLSKKMQAVQKVDKHINNKLGGKIPNDKHAKDIKKAQAVYNKFKPLLVDNRDNYRKYTTKAVHLLNALNQYGDFKHPDSHYNDRFYPYNSKSPAVTNMRWLAFDWCNLHILIRRCKKPTRTVSDLEDIVGLSVMVSERAHDAVHKPKGNLYVPADNHHQEPTDRR